MRRWMTLGFLGLFLFIGAARADMIETKREGLLNGKIVSDNGKELKFKDAKGKERVFKKSDVLFQEKDDPAKQVKSWAQKAWDWIKNLPANTRKTSDQLTEKFIGTVGAPLDRSGANAKADQLARAMDDANRASAAATQKTAAFNAEVYRQKSEAMAVAASSGEKKGRFASLDN